MLPNEPFSLRTLQAAKYGHIKVSLLLNHPPNEKHIFYGPGELIEGRVRLDYRPSMQILNDYDVTQQCRLFVTLRGQVSVRSVPGKMIAKAPKGGEYLGRTLTTLFEDEHCIFDGVMNGLTPRSARTANFQICFPRTVDGDKGCFDAWWNEEDNNDVELQAPGPKPGHHSSETGVNARGYTYNMDPAQPLSPSMSFSERPGPHRMIKNGSDKSGVAIMYDVYARLEMPGIDVSFDYPHQKFEEGMVEQDGNFCWGVRWGTPVLYAPPRVWDTALDFIDNEAGSSHASRAALGTDAQTASGLIQFEGAQPEKSDAAVRLRVKLAAKLSETHSGHPYSWHLSVPKSINQGQPLVVQVKIQPQDPGSNDNSTKAKSSLPSARISLSRVSAEITAHVEARMKLGCHGRQDLAAEESRFEECLGANCEESAFSVRLPFKDDAIRKLESSELCARNDWTTELEFPTITEKLDTSFNTSCVRRRHVMKIKCQALAEDSHREEKFEQSFNITILPFLTREGEESPPPTFALTINQDKNMSSETLPPYEP